MHDFSRQNWGNLSSNIDFLNQTGLLEGRKRILEIGCGQCGLMSFLVDRGHEVIAIDADPEVVSRSPESLDVRLATGDSLPFPDGSFDLVLSFDVFEHIPDSDRHLSEVRRVLRPGGSYLLQTPNKWTNIPFEMVRWSRTHGIRHMFDFLKPPQHCALHGYYELKRRFSRSGLSTQFFEVRVVNDYFVGKIRAHLGSLGLALLRVVNPDKFPVGLRTNFYVKATAIDE